MAVDRRHHPATFFEDRSDHSLVVDEAHRVLLSIIELEALPPLYYVLDDRVREFASRLLLSIGSFLRVVGYGDLL